MKSIKIPCVGYEIAADWYQQSGEGILLFLPGLGSQKATYVDLVSALTDQTNLSALVIDYSGHGVSPFKLDDVTPAQNFLEVITTFDWLVETYPDQSISVIGTSYGGYLGTQLTKYRQFKKFVLRAPGIFKPEDFYTKWEKIDRGDKMIGYRSNAKLLAEHPLLKRASRFEGKALVVVHENDEEIPKPTTDAFARALGAETYVARGFAHSFVEHLDERDKIEQYQKVIADWLKKD